MALSLPNLIFLVAISLIGLSACTPTFNWALKAGSNQAGFGQSDFGKAVTIDSAGNVSGLGPMGISTLAAQAQTKFLDITVRPARSWESMPLVADWLHPDIWFLVLNLHQVRISIVCETAIVCTAGLGI